MCILLFHLFCSKYYVGECSRSGAGLGYEEEVQHGRDFFTNPLYYWAAPSDPRLQDTSVTTLCAEVEALLVRWGVSSCNCYV